MFDRKKHILVKGNDCVKAGKKLYEALQAYHYALGDEVPADTSARIVELAEVKFKLDKIVDEIDNLIVDKAQV